VVAVSFTANNSQIKVCSVTACLNGSITLNIANGLTTDGASDTAIEFDLNVLGVLAIAELQQADDIWIATDTVPDTPGPVGWLHHVEITVTAPLRRGQPVDEGEGPCPAPGAEHQAPAIPRRRRLDEVPAEPVTMQRAPLLSG
jgi:hypothetical protein